VSFDDLDIQALRRRTGAKWARCEDDVLPAWVADMDYPVAEPIRRVLQTMIADSDLGYATGPDVDGVQTAFARRMHERFGWHVDPARVEVLTDVVQGMHLAIQAFTAATDAIVTPVPIYPPFLEAVHVTGRRPVWKRYVRGGSGYEIDFERLRAEMVPETRLLLLCNPHNPTGRVLTRDELMKLAELAVERDLLVLSDEIHAELTYTGHQHIPLAMLGPEIAARTITLTSATKAFNMAGLRCSFAAFGSEEPHRQFRRLHHHHARGGIGSLGMAATVAAWTQCQDWQDEVMRYLQGNRDLVADHVARSWPAVAHVAPQATYLSWLDLGALQLEGSPRDLLLEKCRVMLADGEAFGEGGRGCVRLNFATSRPILREILGRMDTVLRNPA